VIKGLDNALLEMNVGDKKTVTIDPKDAFGERDPKLIKIVPQKMFKDQKVEIRQGMVVDFSGMKGRIQSVAAGRVTVDFNNPLAGKILKYDVEVVGKVDDTADKIKGIFSFVGFHDASVKINNKEAVISVAMPSEIKKKISQMILDNVKDIDKLTYEESYDRK
jgi:FKBP-type peptidyl-prolyl cis-trans isomerase 2